MGFEHVLSKAIEHRARIEMSKSDVRNNTFLIEKREHEMAELSAISSTTQYAHAYLDRLVKEESERFIKRLNEVLDFGVKTIFFDRDYSIEIRVSETGKATIHLAYDDEEGNKLSPDIQVCGGGIRTVVGVLMQIFFIFHYKVEPILFVDEGFSQVSSQYLPGLFSLINELCEKNGLKVLLVTHDPRMMAFAKKQYIVSEGKAKEIKSSMVGEEVIEA